MDVSVIIPTYNRADLLGPTITSLVEQEASSAFEVIVVDNNSTDPTRDVVERHAKKYAGTTVRYVHEPIPGLLSGRHRGYREASGDVLVFVDDDIVAAPSWLAAFERAFADTDVALAGGPSTPDYETEPPRWLRAFWTDDEHGRRCEWLSLLDMGDETKRIDANFIWGLNFAIRKSVLEELGGFHPDNIPKRLQHFQGDGETGVTRAANARDLVSLYVPGAAVSHRVPSSRLTVAYFEERAIYQGVCDSYAAVRAAGTFSAPVRTPADLEAPVGKGVAPSVRLAVAAAVRRAYKAGFAFHQAAVARWPALLDWVLRDDYWDYALPDLEEGV